MKFADLKFEQHSAYPDNAQAVQAKVFFPNGLGASIIRTPGSYGNEDGFYELAVLRGTEEESYLYYKTPITSDVLGHLSESDVESTLTQIEALHHV